MSHAKKNLGAGGAEAGSKFADQSNLQPSKQESQPQAAPGDALPPITLEQLPGEHWLVTIAGVGEVELTTSELQSYLKFRMACLRKFERIFEPIDRDRWCAILNDALAPLREGRP